MAEKRYYWLKLQNDFFKSRCVKKLRRMEDGDTCVIIYLKILVLALENDGVVKFTGVENSLEEELALDLDEDPNMVAKTTEFLSQHELMQKLSDGEYFLTYAVENTGSESSSAERMRRLREKQEPLPLSQRDTDIKRGTAKPSQCDASPSQCDASPSQCDASPSQCDIEKEIEKELDREIDIYPPTPQKGHEEEFDRFWAAYPKHVGKESARKKFEKAIGKVPLDTMLEALEKQKASSQWNRDNKQYIPYPATWLNQCRWEDDIKDLGGFYGTGTNSPGNSGDTGKKWNIHYTAE